MIRRPNQYNDEEDDRRYVGPERRAINITMPSPPEQPKTPMPFWVQLAAFIFTVGASSIGTYMSLHDEQLRLGFAIRQLETDTKEANDIHNKTHEKIFNQIDQLSSQLQSTEQTMTSIMNKNYNRK